MAQNWGLVPMTYEGGNSVGGDWNGGNVLFWEQSKWWHPITQVADINAANGWFAYGGFNFMQYYPPFRWGDWANAEKYVQWQASKLRAQAWKWESSLGTPLPAVLKTDLPHYTGSPGSSYSKYWNPVTSDNWKKAPAELAKGQWKSWIVRAPKRADYTITAKGTGAFAVLLGDTVLGQSKNGVATATVNLCQAIYSVKILSLDSATVKEVEIK
jgi:hypothetical protein